MGLTVLEMEVGNPAYPEATEEAECQEAGPDPRSPRVFQSAIHNPKSKIDSVALVSLLNFSRDPDMFKFILVFIKDKL